MAKMLWKVLAWLFVLCGIGFYLIGGAGILMQTNIFGIEAAVYYYHAAASGIFGIFFLIYSVHSGKRKY